MFKNYFKTAWRNLFKNKFYSAINITGLAIGLAVGIMLLLWVQDEMSYDSFHQNANSIYKINSHLGTGSGAQVWEGSPGPLAVFCKQQIPEVVKGAWPGPKMTMRDWKRQQMKLAGAEVPLVRCLLHEPALNLSIGGKVYESPVFWELNFTNSTTKLEDFSPH